MRQMHLPAVARRNYRKRDLTALSHHWFYVEERRVYGSYIIYASVCVAYTLSLHHVSRRMKLYLSGHTAVCAGHPVKGSRS